MGGMRKGQEKWEEWRRRVVVNEGVEREMRRLGIYQLYATTYQAIHLFVSGKRMLLDHGIGS
jgi:hypothetical protein